MKAEEVVARIGRGVRNALATNEFFLGVEVEAFVNADIHPEYITTVKVGEALAGPDRVVSLETHMKQLRQHAASLARMRSLGGDRARRAMIDMGLSGFVFGKKDSKRLDVLVLDADPLAPPLLMAEAKLGVSNLSGVLKDVDRIIRLLDMFEVVGERSDVTYGAVVFHLLKEDVATPDGRVIIATDESAQQLMEGITAHLSEAHKTRAWLKSKVGLLKSAGRIEKARGYVEDGEEDLVFAKHGFLFSPGLVLVGSNEDIDSINFGA